MTVQLVKIESTPDLVEQVHGALLDAICDGSLAPGARITQELVAEQLDVSRQPVLQALRLLKKDGFVMDAPGRGVLIAPLDVQAVTRIYQVRGALDALAVDLAIQAGATIDPALVERGRRAARGHDVKAMIDADMTFHAAIYAASGNPLIEQAAQLHWRHLRRVMGAVLSRHHERDDVWDEHEAIAQAIASADVAAAQRLAVQHGVLASAKLAQALTQVLQTRTGDKA